LFIGDDHGLWKKGILKGTVGNPFKKAKLVN